MDNAKKIIDRIKQEEIKSTPRWIFKSKNTLVWFGFFVAILVGALAFSIILLAIQQTDFSIVAHMSHSRLELFLSLLPILWLILVLTCSGIAIISIRNSWKGYKFSVFRLISIYLFMSISLGTLFFITGGSQHLEQAFNLNVYSYESIEERKIAVWSNPQEGLLSGNILEVEDEQLRLKDFRENIWLVSFRQSFIAPIVMLEIGEKIKIVGKPTGERQFEAEEIRPWGGPQNRKRGKQFAPVN